MPYPYTLMGENISLRELFEAYGKQPEIACF